MFVTRNGSASLGGIPGVVLSKPDVCARGWEAILPMFVQPGPNRRRDGGTDATRSHGGFEDRRGLDRPERDRLLLWDRKH